MSESELLEVHNQVERILTPEEEERLLACSPLHLKPIIINALNTGMRKGEILSLRWEDVDLENNLITVRQEVSKSRKMRRIPINATLRKVFLEQRLKSNGSIYVFLNSEGNHYKRHDSVKGSFERACRKAEIKGLRFHDLRHTSANHMVETGSNIVAVSRILGHAELKTKIIYSNPEDSEKDAVEKLANFTLNCSNFHSNEEIEQG